MVLQQILATMDQDRDTVRPEEGVVFQMGGSRSRGSSRVIHILSNPTRVHKGVRNFSRVLASSGTLRHLPQVAPAGEYPESTLNARLGALRVTTKLHTPSHPIGRK